MLIHVGDDLAYEARHLHDFVGEGLRALHHVLHEGSIRLKCFFVPNVPAHLVTVVSFKFIELGFVYFGSQLLASQHVPFCAMLLLIFDGTQRLDNLPSGLIFSLYRHYLNFVC